MANTIPVSVPRGGAILSTSDNLLERRRLRTILVTVAVSVLTVLLLAGKPWSDGRTAVLLMIVNSSIFAAHTARYRDTAIVRLLLFGLALGAIELIADALCVRFTRTLDYQINHSPLLLLSPWWMPLAWMLVSAQIGYLGTRLIEQIGTVRGATLTALLGAVNIPFYEEMAYHAHWWQYRNCKMFLHTPYYIVVAELIIGLAIGLLARTALRDSSWKKAALAGAMAGLSTIVGGLVGYGLMERIL